MFWICPECGYTNKAEIVRCICGYENEKNWSEADRRRKFYTSRKTVRNSKMLAKFKEWFNIAFRGESQGIKYQKNP